MFKWLSNWLEARRRRKGIRVKWKMYSPKIMVPTELIADNEIDLTEIEWKRLRDEYGDVAPQVAAAKAKSSLRVPPMPAAMAPVAAARPLSRSDHQIQMRDSSSELCK